MNTDVTTWKLLATGLSMYKIDNTPGTGRLFLECKKWTPGHVSAFVTLSNQRREYRGDSHMCQKSKLYNSAASTNFQVRRSKGKQVKYD